MSTTPTTPEPVDLDAVERPAGGGEKVSGSREAPVPVQLDVLDLSLPLLHSSLP